MLNLNGLWLMAPDKFDAVVDAYTRFEVDQESFEAFIERVSSRDQGVALFVADGSTARIPVIGAITKAPDFFFSIFDGGNAVYGDIIQAVRAADADPSIERIVLEIDSPGGEVSGFFEAARAVADATKPTEAQVTDMATSAAFGLASATDRIVVNNPMAMVGSVGIVTNRMVSESRVTVTSTDAPLKAPDASTEAGQAAIRVELDALHAEFAQVIAAGRSAALGRDVTVEAVNADFGRGGIVLGRSALSPGMIDAISSESSDPGTGSGATGVEAKTDEPTSENVTMTLEELKASHPATYAAIIAEGVTAGVAKERDRVTAHVTAAQSCGDPNIALGFIADGSDFTSQTVQATYHTAGRNAVDVAARVADDEEANANGAGGKPNGDGTGAEDADAKTNSMFDDLETKFGVSAKAAE